jgi:L-asparaginase/Glu-tRNA(Gln) amidotransferase subunit D
MLSSGWVSSSALLPVISSIKITPKLNMSTLVVNLPVTVNHTIRIKKYHQTNLSLFQHITEAIFRIEIHAYKLFNFIQKKAGTKNLILKCIKHQNISLIALLQQHRIKN